MRGPGECTIGEIYSESLEMCAPRLPYPQAWDRTIMKDEIPACEEFFNHACGKWVDSHTNENRAFTYIRRENDKQVKDIINDPNTLGVNQFYQSCVKTLVEDKYPEDSVHQREYMMGKVLQPLVRHSDLTKSFAIMASHGYTIPFQLTIENYPTKPEILPLFKYDGFENLDKHEELVKEHFKLLKGISHREIDRKTKILMKMSRMINFMMPDPVNDLKEYAKSRLQKDTTKFSAFKALSKNFDWGFFLEELGRHVRKEGDRKWLSFNDDQDTWVMDEKYFKRFDPNLFELDEWKIYIEFSVLFNSNKFFPDLPSDAYFTKHDVTMEMPKAKLNRRMSMAKGKEKIAESDCIRAANYLLPGLLAKSFLDDYFPDGENIRKRVIGVVENIRDRFAGLINETSWMDAETKLQAMEKVKDIDVRAVHPSQWSPEPFADQMSSDRYLRNLDIIRAYRVKKNLDIWKESMEGTVFDRDAISNFAGPLSTVNAWYSPSTSTITIFPGILRSPFFDMRYAEASLYGSIGLVAAHELSHSMDDIGRRFDKDGSYVDWWTEDSKEAFHKRAVCVIKEYSTPEGCDNAHYGEQTLCEDIADIVGLRLAFEAFERSGDDPPTADEKRLFFYTFAQNWCESYDQEHLCERVEDDVHAIARYRVDLTLRQIEHFAQAFGCQPGNRMVHDKQCIVYGKDK